MDYIKKTAHGWKKVPNEKDINKNEITQIKTVLKLTDNDFYNSDKSFLLDKIRTDAWKQKIPAGATKPLLLKRNVINRNTGKHEEFKGEDKKILHYALEKGNVIRHNKPNEKPNYYVIAKSGSYYYMATIDIDPQKKYNEVVDWRKVNEKKFK